MTGLPRGGVGGKRGPEPSWEVGGEVHTLRLFPRGRPLLLCHSPTGWCTQKNRKKKINIKAKRERERWYTEMPGLGRETWAVWGRGAREAGKEVKVPGAWVTPGPAGQPPTGTEETDRRHHRQTDGRGTRPTDGMAWPQAPGPGLCFMQCTPALAPADTQSLGRGRPSAGLSQPSPGAQRLCPGGGWGKGAGSHMQLGAPPTQVLCSQRPARSLSHPGPARHSTASPHR